MGFLGHERKDCGCVGRIWCDICVIDNSVQSVNVQSAHKVMSRIFLKIFSGKWKFQLKVKTYGFWGFWEKSGIFGALCRHVKKSWFCMDFEKWTNFRYIMRTSEKMPQNRGYCCFQESIEIFMTWLRLVGTFKFWSFWDLG